LLQTINEKAQQIADNAVPTAEKVSGKLNKGAADLAANAEEGTDKLSSKAQDTAQKVADNAMPKTEELINYLKVPHPPPYNHPRFQHTDLSLPSVCWKSWMRRRGLCRRLGMSLNHPSTATGARGELDALLQLWL